ncbi:MAG TPA: hypothetical protein VM123_11790 [archaeon]|nr:hypothetical protein [archaeon]
MKRFYLMVLLMLNVFYLFSPSPAKAKVIGDFNNDGKINVLDLVEFLGYLGGKRTVPEIGQEMGDVIHDTVYIDKIINWGNVVFDSKGIRIDTTNNHINIGNYGEGSHPLTLKVFSDGREVVNIASDNYGGFSTGLLELKADNGNEDYPNILIHGMNLKLYNGANLVLPDWAFADKLYVEDFGDAFICWDYQSNQIKIRRVNYPYDDADNWSITPDQEGEFIEDLAVASNNPEQLSDCVSKADYDSLVIKFNAVLALLKKANIMADILK